MTYDSRPATHEHITEVRRLLLRAVKELLDRAHGHDASKLVDPELEMFNEFTPRLRELTFGSDEYKRALADMGAALQHHYAHNRHHPEHFDRGIRDMTLIDLLELVCDWIAATQRNAGGDVRRSLEVNQARFGYSDELREVLLNTVEALGMLP